MGQCTDFIADQPPEVQALLHYVHDLILGYPELTCRLAYRIPFYYGRRWVAYCNPRPDGAVEIAFPRGRELADPGGLLESKGRKLVRSVTYADLAAVDEAALRAVIEEAIALDIGS